MVLFVEVVEEEETLDFTKNFYRCAVRQKDRREPPPTVCRFVDFANVVESYCTLVGYKRRKILVDKKG